MPHRVLEVKARDGISLPCGIWEARGDVILYLHGIESHMGWFSDMADIFQKEGFSVYALDRRGSGLSKEERGHIESYKILLDDVHDVIKKIREKHPAKRLYLMGICGGGKIASDFAGYDPHSIDGLILIVPAIKTKVTLPAVKKLDVFVSSFLNPKKKIPTPLSEDMFTKNERYLDFIRNDSLSLHELTARFYMEWARMGMALGDKIRDTDIPILTVLAGEDPIVNNEAMKKWYGRLGARDKTLKVFSGCSHFLPFQENVTDITRFIADWIRERSPS